MATTREVIDKAIDVFDSINKANAWLYSSIRALDYKCPIDLMDTDEGREQVIAILTRIEHGVYS